MTQRTVKSQAELDQAVADGVDRIIINSPAGVWITITSRVAEVKDNACVRVANGGRVGRVANGGRVEWVANGGRVERVANGGRVGRVDNGGRVEWVANGGRVEWVDNGGLVGRVDNGGRVERATKTAAIHLYGGTLTHAAPTVAVFVHTGDSTWSGGTLIDLRDLDLTDVDVWRTWADAYVNPDCDRLIVSNVSSEDHYGQLSRDGEIVIGCFEGDLAKLRKVIEGDEWPSGADAERRAKYRPRILAFADLCDEQMAAWASVAEVAK